jgi:uncharacterized protein
MKIMKPIASNERVQLLDVIRGIAILGMFVVNMAVDWWPDVTRAMQLASPDFLTVIFVHLFAKGKFFTIFSFLFGIGFFVLMERVHARSVNHLAFYVRRSVGLLLIGILAWACTLLADMLIYFGIFGLALLLFYKRSPRTILAMAVVCILLTTTFSSIVPEIRESLELQALAAEQGVSVSDVSQPVDPIDEAWDALLRDGDFLQLSSALLADLRLAFSTWGWYVGKLDLMGLMLLGLYVGRRGAVWNADIRRMIARKALPWLIGVGFGGCLIWVAMEDFGIGDSSSLAHTMIRSLAGWPLGMNALGLGYAAAITLLINKDSWRRLLTPFAAVGRMALTNYLFTTLIGAFIGWSWGLGLYGRIMPATGFTIAIGVFFFQALASNWWMRRFRFGPVEWLWRSSTYGKLPAMRAQYTADA